jgi:Holliday junction DNA helicase RuvA
MIAKLTGILDSTGEDWAVVDVSGVGYLVHCSARTLSALPRKGEAVRLFVDTQMRESQIYLYGFADAAERDWFGLLQSVQGVGARVALAILSVLTPGEIVQAVAAQDKALVGRANGVGPKLAGRIVSELKDKVANVALGPAALGGGEAVAAKSAGEAMSGGAADAVSALINLGYGRAEAFTAVAAAARELGGDAGVEALIRGGLKELAA